MYEIRQDRDIQRFVEDVGHLVLKVLRSHCDVKQKVKKKEGICERNSTQTDRVYELLPVCAFETDNFTAIATDLGVHVERRPDMINRTSTFLDTDIELDA